MGQSLAQQVAALPEDERAAILDGLSPDELLFDADFWLRPEQMPPNDDSWHIYAAVAGRGWGKPLDAETPIPTPGGWTKIKDLRPGDRVFDHAGRPTRVTAVYDPGTTACYEVSFRNGQSLVAGDTHEWTVLGAKDKSIYQEEHDPREFNQDWWRWAPPQGTTRGGRKFDRVRRARTIETHELARSQSIFATAPLDLPRADLLVDPYVLGLWLGDGSTRDGDVCAHPDDAPFIREMFVSRGYDDVTLKTRSTSGDGSICGLKSKKLVQQLRELGLLGDKRVPAEYLRGSVEQRLDLLRGLMDTDGSCDRGIVAGAGFILKNLTDALYELVTSLGVVAWRQTRILKATKLQPERPFHGIKWRPTPSLNPFYMPRKASLVKEMPRLQSFRKVAHCVTEVVRVEDRPLVCISVEGGSQLFLAGEGMIPTHNSRASSEWVRRMAREHPGCRIGLVARTAADVRDVMIEGESGIMSITPPSELPVWSPSKRRVEWPNGSTAIAFSSESPSQLRGVQFHYTACDEVAAWDFKPDDSGLNAWENAVIATRLGESPQVLATTTPKRTPFMFDLFDRAKNDSKVKIVNGKTTDNAGNLSESYLNFVHGMYKGTRLALQELEGLMLEQVDGALWTDQLIQSARVNAVPLGLPYRVIAVDPSVAENPKDECGIVVAAATGHSPQSRHAYVLDDLSVHGSPDVWAKRVVAAYEKWQCPVVVEVNQGGGLVRRMINSIDPKIPIFDVRATQGKATRAEPVLLKYDQGRVHHVGWFPELENQLTSWVPFESPKSPDRLDALVWAIVALMVDPPKAFLGGSKLRARSMAGHQLQGVKKTFQRRR